MFQSLESRQMLSATNSVVIIGSPGYQTLRIIGSDRIDTIVVNLHGNGDGTVNATINLNGKRKVGNHLAIRNVNIDARGGADTVNIVGDSFPSDGNFWLYATGGLGNDNMSVVTDGTLRAQIDGGRGDDTMTLPSPTTVPTETEDILVISDTGPSVNQLNVFGNSGNDTLLGGDGDDQLNGGTGNDVIYGNGGDDNLNGEAGNDTIFGGEGDDQANGGDGIDELHGGPDNDYLQGGNGNDLLYGDQGENNLYGGAGENIITIGEAGYANVDGNDIVYGSAEDDNVSLQSGGRVVFYGGAGEDWITRPIGSDNNVALYDVEHDNVYDPNDNNGKG